MDYMKKLNRKGMFGTLLLVLFLAIMGISFLAGSNLFTEPPEAEDLWDVPRDELEGSYVTVELDFIYGCYAYSEVTRDGRPTGEIKEREYLIDANEEDYMVVILSGKDMDKAEELMKQSEQYYYGEIDEITASFEITGYVRKMPSDSQRMLYDWVGYHTLSPAEQEIYLPLALEREEFETEIILVVFGAALLGIAAFMLIRKLSGHQQKMLRTKLELLFGGNRERSNDFMKFMLENVPNVHGMRIARGYMLIRLDGMDMLLDSNDLVWAYRQITQHKLYGIIPTGKTYALMLCTADGKRSDVALSEKATNEILNLLKANFPQTVIGYSKELESLYLSNRAAMAGVAAAQRNQNL